MIDSHNFYVSFTGHPGNNHAVGVDVHVSNSNFERTTQSMEHGRNWLNPRIRDNQSIV